MMSANRIVNTNKGFTMVELLVGMVLSIFISGVAFTYMASTTKSFRVLTNDSIIQENARFALEILSENFRLAGRNETNDFSRVLSVVYRGTICSSDEDGIAHGASGATTCTVDSLANNSDRIAVDYLVSAVGSAVDLDFTGCNGRTITATAGDNVRLASVFWSADIDDDGIRSLYCQTYNIDTGLAEGVALPLIEGVDRFQVQYGADTTVDGAAADAINFDGIVDRYQSFTNLINVDAGLLTVDPQLVSNTIKRVRAIRMALLLNSGTGVDEDSSTEKNITRSYTLLDGAAEDYSDSRIRKIYSTTVLIPNTE